MYMDLIIWLLSGAMRFRIAKNFAWQLGSLKMEACCCVTSLVVGTFLLNKVMHVGLFGLFRWRVLNINGEVNSFAKNTKLGCVSCRFMDWSAKSHHHKGRCWVQLLWKTSPAIERKSVHSFDQNIGLWMDCIESRFINLKRLQETLD